MYHNIYIYIINNRASEIPPFEKQRQNNSNTKATQKRNKDKTMAQR